MKKSLLLVFVAIAVLCRGQQYSQKWTDVNYVGDGQVYHNADIYLPKATKTSYPVVLYIYGSAWQSNNGKGADMSSVGAALLDAGYAVVCINHRSSSDAKWPAQINDVKAAIRFVRGSAATYKFDTCFVGISGSSSGGHLSDVAGLSRNVKSFTVGSKTMDIEGTLGKFKGCSSSIDAVCDWFGPKYLIKMDSCGNTTQHGADNSPGSGILGCAIKTCTDNAALLEPRTYIDPSDPPFLIFHGTADAIVPYCASVFLNKELKSKGVQSEYVEIAGGGHYSNMHTSTNLAKMVTFFNGVKDKTCSPSNISVSVTAPANNAAYDAPATIELAASASTTQGTISKVEFFNGATRLGEDATSPYGYSWDNVAAGTYSITAVATDNSGKTATSTAISVKVNAAQTAYNGTPWPVPGKIEIELFDQGGNGSAYLDNAADNTGGADFRKDEDVDIEDCKDDGAGYNIGLATSGEWLEYTVNVAAAGEYDLTIRAACNGTGRSISLSSNGSALATDIAIPNTEGWQAWQDVKTKVTLAAGTQVLRLTIGATDYVNLNYMTFSSLAAPLPKIPLKAGWNIVGYPHDDSADIATAMASIWADVETVKNLDSFYSKANAAALNSLTTLHWGEGYLVKVSKDCELDWGTK